MKAWVRIKSAISTFLARFSKKDDKRTVIGLEHGSFSDGTSMVFFDCSDDFDTGGK